MASLLRMQILNDHSCYSSDNSVDYKSASNGNVSHANLNNNTTSVDVLTEVQQENEAVNLTWRDVSYHVTKGFFGHKEKKCILSGVSGLAPSGMLTVILGPSGAGKTTLLNILSGFKCKSHKGEVLVNGKKPSPNFYRENSCYIPQETYLFPHLTVKQTVRTAAELKLPRSTSKTEKKQRVEDVLEMLRLTDVKSSKANLLSGGEKKRLSIAQDLVSNPQLMILDEPTSGLDSALSYQCVQLLQNLAREGRTIICTIHQPSSAMYQLFDSVHVLSKGNCLYSGLGRDLTSYLASCNLEYPQHYNPADFMIDVASGVRPGEDAILKKRDEIKAAEQLIQEQNACSSSLHDKKDSFLKNALHLLIDGRHYPTSFFHRFSVLISREFWSTLGQPTLAIVCLLAHVALAGMIGVVYRTSGWNADIAIANVGLLALLTIILGFAAILPTLLTFPTEKMAVLREYHNGWYSVNSYFFAKTIAGIPFNVLFPFVFVSIVYWLTGQIPETWRYLYFVALSICLTVSAESIPLIFGAVCTQKVTAFLVPAFCLPLILFSKVFFIGNSMPDYVNWISYVSPFAQFYQGVMLVIYGFDRGPMECSGLCLFRRPEIILSFLGMEDNDIYWNFGILGAIIVVLRFLGYVCLNLRIRRLK